MNTNRFLNVARWNFAINRSQYFKMALSLFIVMSVPLLLAMLRSVWAYGVMRSIEGAHWALSGSNMGGWMVACYIIAMPILCGYMFHNMLTKQTRIKELTLPASNCEKFVFHALTVTVGGFLVYVLSFLVIDIVQYLYVGAVYGFSFAKWIPYGMAFGLFAGVEEMGVEAFMLINLGWMAYLSTFILGNALKYRHNVLWTIVFHMVLGLVSLFAVGLLMPLLLNLHIDITGIDGDVLVWLAMAFFILIIVFCWWQAYRLYCRAQITTLRNK